MVPEAATNLYLTISLKKCKVICFGNGLNMAENPCAYFYTNEKNLCILFIFKTYFKEFCAKTEIDF